MIGAKNHHGVLPIIVLVENIQYPSQPVINHGELGTIIISNVFRFTFRNHAAGNGIGRIRRPDDLVALPVGLVEARPRFWRIKGFMRIKLINEQQK